MKTFTEPLVYAAGIKKILCVLLNLFVFAWFISAQSVYVDSKAGNDNNPGTKKFPVFSVQKAADIIRSSDNTIYSMKLNPGIYVLDHVISVQTEKEISGKHIVIEAVTLPGDSGWAPEKMPVIVNTSIKGTIPGFDQWIVSFLIGADHVVIRGIKFPGYFYPNSYYFPVARIDKSKADLCVEQCMFTGDEQTYPIQVAVIGHGDKIKIDHCIFYNCNNAVVFWGDSGNGIKTGNNLTNSIIIVGFCAIWTSMPDKDFVFENNIVSKAEYFWVTNYFNKTVYPVNNCLVINNQHYQGVWHEEGVIPEEFRLVENNVIKEGNISLRLMDNIDNPMPLDYLHVIPYSSGYGLRAGLFMNR